MKLNTGAKEIQQVNPGGPDKQPKLQDPTILSIDKSLSRNRHTAKIYPSNKYNIFPSFIIDQSRNTLKLKNIVLSFHPHFEPITSLFTITGL